ncbi:hypothetical protein HOY80DRAFT_970801 [Tuber brumale]|nr:hypothetical protein HOY80DRAFT_970801 [Tuber brumale]
MISVIPTPRSLVLMNLIPMWWPSARNAVLVQQVSRKIIRPLDTTISDTNTSLNRAIHTVIAMLCKVVSVKCLLCLECSRPGATRGPAGKSTRGAGMRAAVAGALVVLAEDSREIRTGVPGSVRGSNGGGDVAFRVYLFYPIGGPGTIGGRIPRAKNRIPAILFWMQRESAES